VLGNMKWVTILRPLSCTILDSIHISVLMRRSIMNDQSLSLERTAFKSRVLECVRGRIEGEKRQRLLVCVMNSAGNKKAYRVSLEMRSCPVHIRS